LINIGNKKIIVRQTGVNVKIAENEQGDDQQGCPYKNMNAGSYVFLRYLKHTHLLTVKIGCLVYPFKERL
jgi:hypothetical protein